MIHPMQSEMLAKALVEDRYREAAQLRSTRRSILRPRRHGRSDCR